MSTTTEQAVFDAAQELQRAYDGRRQAVQAGRVTVAHHDRVTAAEQAWTKVRRGRLEAGQVAA